MIEINLVPQHLRKKRRSRILIGGGFFLPREIVAGMIGGIGVLLVIIHVILQFMIGVKYIQHRAYSLKLDRIAAQKGDVDQVFGNLKRLQNKMKTIESLLGKDYVLWSQKLNQISDVLPRGVWLTRLTLEDKALMIQGSSVSKESDQMIFVHNYTSQLKEDEAFAVSFKNMELGLIRSRKINGTPVADFTITAELKK